MGTSAPGPGLVPEPASTQAAAVSELAGGGVEGNDVERNESVSEQNPQQPSSPFAGLGPGLVTAAGPGLGIAQGPGLVDSQRAGPGLVSSEEEWLHTLQAYLTFPDDGIDMTKEMMECSSNINPSLSVNTRPISDMNAVIQDMDNNSVGKFVGASGLRKAPGQGLASGPGSPELGLGVALGQEQASAKEQGQGLASGVLPTGLSSDEIERLRTMEKLLALIGDPLGGQGLGTATAAGPGLGTSTAAAGPGLGTELEQEGDVLVTTDCR